MQAQEQHLEEPKENHLPTPHDFSCRWPCKSSIFTLITQICIVFLWYRLFPLDHFMLFSQLIYSLLPTPAPTNCCVTQTEGSVRTWPAALETKANKLHPASLDCLSLWGTGLFFWFTWCTIIFCIYILVLHSFIDLMFYKWYVIVFLYSPFCFFFFS